MEYYTVASSSIDEDRRAQLAREGWRLTECVTGPTTDALTLIFKRHTADSPR